MADIVSIDSFAFTDGRTTRQVSVSTTYDDFTGTVGDDISAAKWTSHPSVASGNSDIVIDSTGGRARGLRTGISIYYGNTAPASADQSLEWDFVSVATPVAGTMEHGFGCRVPTGTDSGYFGVFYRNMVGGITEWRIVKRASGTETTLASASTSVTNGVTYHVAFSVVGSTLTLSVDGSQVCTTTDSSITATGRYAIYMDPINATSTADGRLDNLTVNGGVVDQPCIGPEVVQPLASDSFAAAEALKLSASLRLVETVSAFESTALDASVRSRDAFATFDSGFVTISGPILVADADAFGSFDASNLAVLLGWGDSFAATEGLALAAGVGSADLASWASLELYPSVYVISLDSFIGSEALGRLSAAVAYGEDFGLEDGCRITATTTSTDSFAEGDQGEASLFVAPLAMGDADRFAFSESASVLARVHGGDAVVIADRAAVAALLGSADAAALVDFALQTTAPVGIVGIDSAGFVDAARLSVAVSSADSASIYSASIIVAGVASRDSFALTHLSLIALNVIAFDAFGFAEEQSFRAFTGSIAYNIYSNSGDGGPINYGSIRDTVSGLTWTSPPLDAGSDWWFAVRAYAVSTALEEKNADAAVHVILDADRADVTNRPPAPSSIRAVPLAGGFVRVEWVDRRLPARATGYRVYQGVGSVDWNTPVATVAVADGIAGAYAVTLGPLSDGVAYRFGVRAHNATAEESNTVEAAATADATGPAPPTTLDLSLTSES